MGETENIIIKLIFCNTNLKTKKKQKKLAMLQIRKLIKWSKEQFFFLNRRYLNQIFSFRFERIKA